MQFKFLVIAAFTAATASAAATPLPTPKPTSKPTSKPTPLPTALPTTSPTFKRWTGKGCPKPWASGTEYEGGELAEVDGVVYQCSSAQFVNIWCSQAGYKPGDSIHWSAAWTRLGSCDGTIAPSGSPIYVSLKDAGGCPDEYKGGSEYEEGDKVAVNSISYKCRGWPNSAFCGKSGYEPGGTYSSEAWTLLGYCDGTITPTASPNYKTLEDAGGCPDDYENSVKYEAGDKVSIVGNGAEKLIYECSDDVHQSRYCAEYEPGHWSKLGWKLLGYCDGTIAPTSAPSWLKLPDNNGCPKAYESKTDYEAGDEVSVAVNGVDSVVYKCSDDIHQARYCNQHEPGNDYNLGWKLIAHCDGTISPTSAPNFSKLTEFGSGCPKKYSSLTDYEEGDVVSVFVSGTPDRAVVYACKGWPEGAYCNAGENFSPESKNRNMGWTLKGYCDGTIAPTASPIVYPDPKCRWYNGTKPVIILTWSTTRRSTYVAGTRVRKEDRIYKCKSYPASLWCQQAAYQPEESTVWSEAWTSAGTCLDAFAPTGSPTTSPTSTPSDMPSEKPSRMPSVKPSSRPSRQPSEKPSRMPSLQPSEKPSRMPSIKPSSRPSLQPSEKPSRMPSIKPSSRPSLQPSDVPSKAPVPATSP